MARYLPMFALQVRHEFFEGDATAGRMGLHFTPDANSAITMQQENLLLRRGDAGFEIWQEQREQQQQINPEDETTSALAKPTGYLDLRFLVTASDPAFNSYTDWNMDKPIQFENAGSLQLSATTQLADEVETNNFAWQRTPLQFSLRLQHALDQGMTQYEILLKAKALHWKYFFTGAAARKSLQIIDLDSESKEDGLSFQRSSAVVNSTGLAFLSTMPIPMRSIPTQRFQLREEGANGRVLMRRMPNASIHQIGKERVPGGQTLVVAEIYIHQ